MDNVHASFKKWGDRQVGEVDLKASVMKIPKRKRIRPPNHFPNHLGNALMMLGADWKEPPVTIFVSTFYWTNGAQAPVLGVGYTREASFASATNQFPNRGLDPEKIKKQEPLGFIMQSFGLEKANS